jgi:hypothetical protein
MRRIMILGLSLIASLPAVAQEAPKLEGTVLLDAEACGKGYKGPDCVLSFDIQGEAAKILYNGMSAKAKHEECTGGMEKSDGKGLHCIMAEDKTYSCDFGYHFAKKTFGGSNMDC